MRRPLFWKILFGFWLTIILITQGVYLLLALPASPLEVSTDGTDVEHFAISIAAAAVSQGGIAALNEQTAHWPQDLRDGLVIDKPVRTLSTPGGTSIQVKDPQGVIHDIGYRAIRSGFFQKPKYIFLSVVGGLAFSAILAWYLTNPIWKIRRAFRRLAEGEFSVRLRSELGRRKDEITDLADDFDDMADRLQLLIESRDQLMASISHELRSPLTRLNVAIGIAKQDPSQSEATFARIEKESQRLDALVGELLALCKLETSPQQIDEYFDVVHLIETVCKDAEFEANHRGVVIDFQAGENYEQICRGSARLIRGAIENVLRNAVRFSPDRHTVEVTVTEGAPGRVRIDILDQGPGMPAETLRALFEPFNRGPGQNESSVFGLAISYRAISANGGTIAVRNRSIKGLAVAIELPIAT
jgi:two-component system OmpR family sensor kinase